MTMHGGFLFNCYGNKSTNEHLITLVPESHPLRLNLY